MNKVYLEKSLPLIKLAIAEDLGEGDITTNVIITDAEKCVAKLMAKSDGIVAGIDVAKMVFDFISKNSVNWNTCYCDGDAIKSGDVIAEINGSYATILSGERTALNFLQRLSGVATLTNQFVKKLAGLNTTLLDTRKTLPAFRYLDKYAVKIGGGNNHRFGLYDMIMIKENHIKAAGSISDAVKMVRNIYGNKYKVEIETTNINEVREALSSNVDIIMLDNMNVDIMREAIILIKGRVKTEASGNVNLNTVKRIAETGVDFISVGAITHSVKALDISLLIT